MEVRILQSILRLCKSKFTLMSLPWLIQSYSWGSEEEALSLESVWVLLQVHTTFPSVISKSFVKEAFKRKKFIDDELARTVADLVMVRYDLKHHLLQNWTLEKRDFKFLMLRLFIKDILPFAEGKHTRSKSTRRPSSERNYQDAVRNQLSSNFVDQTHLTQHPEGVLL